MPKAREQQDDLYDEVVAIHGAALARLGRAYEMDPDKRRDLMQEVHLALWRSLARFEGACSLRTWVYRVAHNVAASHVLGQRRLASRRLISLDDAEATLAAQGREPDADRAHTVGRVYDLIHQLKPLERQIILLYLEGCDAASIAEVTGISAGNAATRIHRIKRLLAERYRQGVPDERR